MQTLHSSNVSGTVGACLPVIFIVASSHVEIVTSRIRSNALTIGRAPEGSAGVPRYPNAAEWGREPRIGKPNSPDYLRAYVSVIFPVTWPSAVSTSSFSTVTWSVCARAVACMVELAIRCHAAKTKRGQSLVSSAHGFRNDQRRDPARRLIPESPTPRGTAHVACRTILQCLVWPICRSCVR